MFIPHKAYVLVVDGARMQLLRNVGPLDDIVLEVISEASQSNPASHVLEPDRPGRSFESAAPGRHAHETPDLHQRREDEFVREALATLESIVADDGEIVLIAPLRILGQLRAEIGKNLAPRLHAELDKDLAHRSVREIELFLRIHRE